jgi:uncharacterized protein (DUF2267 family)
MNRLDGFLRALILVAATFFVTEWVHYRVGTPAVFHFFAAEPDANSGAKSHEPDSVTESEFQIYLRVLEAMQSDHALAIEDAVQSEYVSLAKFRDLEQRIQRNDMLIDRIRHSLREKAESLWRERGEPLEHG